MKLLSLLALIATTATAIALPEVSTTSDAAGSAQCSFHLTWRQMCYDGFTTNSVDIPYFRNKDGHSISTYTPQGHALGDNGKLPWILKRGLAHDFTVAKVENPLRLTFNFENCDWATDASKDCGRCYVGDWTAAWNDDFCQHGSDGNWRTSDMDCFMNCQ